MLNTVTRDVYLFLGRNNTLGMEDVAFHQEMDSVYDALTIRVRLRALGFVRVESHKVMRNTYQLFKGELKLTTQEPVFRHYRNPKYY